MGVFFRARYPCRCSAPPRAAACREFRVTHAASVVVDENFSKFFELLESQLQVEEAGDSPGGRKGGSLPPRRGDSPARSYQGASLTYPFVPRLEPRLVLENPATESAKGGKGSGCNGRTSSRAPCVHVYNPLTGIYWGIVGMGPARNRGQVRR